jgi:hypothetical protein
MVRLLLLTLPQLFILPLPQQRQLLTLANITAATIYVTVLIDNADGDNVNFLKSVPIPTGSSIEVMAGNKVNLETGDIIKVKSDVANSLDTCLSIMEQT